MTLALPQYPKLPHAGCVSNCGDCCTITGGNEAEYQAVNEYAAAHNITPIRQGIRCPWYQGGQCAVYPVRPMVCRLYGHTPKMTCSFGHNCFITPRRERKIMGEYVDSYGSSPRFLHEVVYSTDEVIHMIENEIGQPTHTEMATMIKDWK